MLIEAYDIVRSGGTDLSGMYRTYKASHPGVAMINMCAESGDLRAKMESALKSLNEKYAAKISVEESPTVKRQIYKSQLLQTTPPEVKKLINKISVKYSLPYNRAAMKAYTEIERLAGCDLTKDVKSFATANGCSRQSISIFFAKSLRRYEMKYYITNGDRYVTAATDSEITIGGVISYAKRFTQGTAKKTHSLIAATHPEYCVQKYYSSSSKKDYVITTAKDFVGNNGAVKCFNQARSFDTAADADGFLRSHSKLSGWIIVNETFRPVNVYGEAKIQKCNTKKLKLGICSEKVVRQKNIPQDIRAKVFKRDGGVCQICGRPLTEDNFTVDHIIQVNRDGENDISNYRCLCDRCNKWKADSLDSELLRYMQNVGSNYLYINPFSETADMMIRAIVRGAINMNAN